MTKRNPDRRRQKQLKKIETESQARKTKACLLRIDGLSYYEIAERLGMSHQWAKNVCDLLLEVKTPKRKIRIVGPRGGVKHKTIRETYQFKKGYKALLPSKKRGPAPGNTPVCDAIEGDVVAARRKYPMLGAEKIGVIAGVGASAPTVRKTLLRNGFGNITKKKGKAYKRFAQPCPNDMWQIDYVDMGHGAHLLSVIDDHSRKILSKNLRYSWTTDDVIEIVWKAIEEHGVPRSILSDHGCQWYSTCGGDARFDEFCEELGIKHYMGGIRKPTTTGKVERWHGSLRRETNIDELEDIEDKRRVLYGYIDFYNTVRPHYALGLRTPDQAYSKTCFEHCDPIAQYVLA